MYTYSWASESVFLRGQTLASTDSVETLHNALRGGCISERTPCTYARIFSSSPPHPPSARCTHPMFGPESGAVGWAGLPFVYDRVRTMDHGRTADFLSIWEGERCKMVDMSCELHDKYAANTQFITHLMGRILGKQVRILTNFLCACVCVFCLCVYGCVCVFCLGVLVFCCRKPERQTVATAFVNVRGDAADNRVTASEFSSVVPVWLLWERTQSGLVERKNPKPRLPLETHARCNYFFSVARHDFVRLDTTLLCAVQGLSRTPIDTQGFSSALRLMETTCADSFELFYGLFRYNPHSHTQLRKLRDSFAEVERQVCVSGV